MGKEERRQQRIAVNTGRKQARAKWENEIGPIPAEFMIHHIDGDPTNNKLDNLACISSKGKGHRMLHLGIDSYNTIKSIGIKMSILKQLTKVLNKQW